jgi:hypothetical protein
VHHPQFASFSFHILCFDGEAKEESSSFVAPPAAPSALRTEAAEKLGELTTLQRASAALAFSTSFLTSFFSLVLASVPAIWVNDSILCFLLFLASWYRRRQPKKLGPVSAGAQFTMSFDEENLTAQFLEISAVLISKVGYSCANTQ